jgi:glycosyltransferase involved in cell wall biosynthesis
MRILLVANYVRDKQPAKLRYSEMLRRNLTARGHLVELIRPGAVLGRRTRWPLLRRCFGYVDKYVLFPLKLRSAAQGFDLVHVCDQQNSMYLAHTGGVPSSITCHDLLAISAAQAKFPQQRVSGVFRARQRAVRRHLQDAKNVICVSWKTARELGAMCENRNQRRVVIPNAVEIDAAAISQERVAAVRGKIGLPKGDRYLLHVSGEQWYKNRPGVLRMFRIIRERRGDGLRLVMAGAPLTPEMREFVAANLPHGSVVEVHAPADEDLWALYAGATALLFPSLYEGFGWPIVEAQSCGCPVITSNRAPMTEVAGPAALYVDPRDEAAAAETIAAKLDGIGRLRDAGFENAKRFQPEVVFASYEGFFRGVLRTRRITDVVVAANEAETAAGQSREG